MATFKKGLKEGSYYAVETNGYYGMAFQYDSSILKEGRKISIHGFYLNHVKDIWEDKVLSFDKDQLLQEISKEEFEILTTLINESGIRKA